MALFAPERKAFTPRYYQEEALTGILTSLEWYDTTLVRMATGMGKSVLFSEFAKRVKGRVLLLAHRDELVTQARKHLERATGEWVEVEQAELHSGSARIVVASVASITQQHRLKRLGRDRFDYILVDEAHHAVARTWKRVFSWFETAKVVGFTATSDRGDGKALAQVFEDAAYVMDIHDGVEAGFLVPVVGRRVKLDKIDLRKVKSVAGDLNQGQLDAVMAEAVEGIVKTTLREYPDRKGIAFFPGVRSAEYATHRFNELKPHSAVLITGTTDKDERRGLVDDFKAGRYQYLCNCGIATEGFDDPDVSLVIPKLTKSRALYTQMVGRGTRVLPGTVDHHQEKAANWVRREAIRHSKKSDLVVLDFVGNSGKHDLVSPEDVLGGKYSEPEIRLAKKKSKEAGGGDPEEHLKAARTEIEDLARAVESSVESSLEEFNPFGVFNNSDISKYSMQQGFKPASEKQRSALERIGMEPKDARAASMQQAQKILSTAAIRRKHGLANYWQLAQLNRHGITKTSITQKRAQEAIGYIRGCNGRPDAKRLRSITDRVGAG